MREVAFSGIDGLLELPGDPSALLVLAHGAGAPMRHVFLEEIARALAARGIGTLRFAFPYAQRGAKAPDPPAVLERTVRAAVAAAAELAPGLPLLAGGKSMGGRMTSQLAAEEPLPGVRGLVFLGFPLHPAGRPATTRGAHLLRVPLPMLLVQGTRDALADLALLTPIVESLGGRATLHVVEDGDHGFHVRKRSGRDDAAVLQEIAEAVARFAAAQAAR
jgi:predicted alpha/beta-hydrolase family hydrolase